MTREQRLKQLAAAHKNLATIWNRWFDAVAAARADGIEVKVTGGLSMVLPPDMPRDDHGFSKRAEAYFKTLGRSQ